MSEQTKLKIINSAKDLFANYGYHSVTMRKIASEANIRQSDIYNYFSSKDDMLKKTFDITRKDLGEKRKKVKEEDSFDKDIANRIKFLFENSKDVNYILKYFFQFKSSFQKNEQGYVPNAAYKHIEEVLKKWIGVLNIEENEIPEQSKIITHAINGFVLEYFPNEIEKTEQNQMINSITRFISKSLIKV
ncbi:MAG: hypothetical protein QG570_594 [Patescibacteria group bacterium]|nr:hypothetical protein [Patescibacteria group bacterium]